MHLRIADAARLLGVEPDVVLRWIKERGLPAQRLGQQFHINSVELQEWALANHVRMAPPKEASEVGAGGEASADIAAAIERGGVHAGVTGATRDAVLSAVVRLPGLPESIDRDLLLQLLLAREMLGSTGVGGGIAIPHPRTPIVLDVDMPPLAVAAYLEKPIDFKAIDGKPVWMLFLLLSPTIQVHLKLLAQLSWALHDAEVRKLFEQRAPLAPVLDRLRALRATKAGAR
jgi:PTS system nitrogen regulatory IIA component